MRDALANPLLCRSVDAVQIRAFGGSAAEHFSAYSFNMSQPAPAAAYAANIVPLSSQLSLSWYFYNVKNVVSILYKYAKTILLKPFYQLLILMQL